MRHRHSRYLLPLAWAATAALLAGGCDSDGGRSGSSDNPRGLWQGTVDDATNDVTRSAESLILPSGFWLLASYSEGSDPLHARPFAAVFGITGGNDEKLQGTGTTYTPENQRLPYSWAGEAVFRERIEARYFKFQEGQSSAPAENGSVTLTFNPEFDAGGSPSRLSGQYLNQELSLSISLAGAVFGQGMPDSQTGECNFNGALRAEDTDSNGFIGVADLGEDPDCRTGSTSADDDDFQMLAWLTEEPLCEAFTGQTQALVLGMHNGVIAHHFRRLCRAG